eukprot:1392680-Amorphochlora_amoeboformis.AAC.1
MSHAFLFPLEPPFPPTKSILISDPRIKPRGIKAARKLRSHRRVSKWAQKKYNKSHSQARYNKQLYNLASHAKGIVVEKVSSSLDLTSSFSTCVCVSGSIGGRTIGRL